mmetsp:Transcript_17731/g.30536  ORF Transcript_17731/g.30536 Transcript_17731/m.30536 type:complete len:167 (+) Transcript_17731:111-611(+)|eukprot:CAMPEP_0196657766 /NCGR_PEP_ID=MMETSP1086-20130531/25390_1 /TAXON_ID=77921 /ORGANISM="Cyanoptyche  gloeocystis , Strain SAG4.97" /LENGTH=166 /DNA_ID=CAMNT_0041991031 /DNA_START=104 /DNA_END=604 /DNA_ORIENTATION=+
MRRHVIGEEEQAEIADAFNMFDTDQDGYIPLEDLGNLLRSQGKAFSNAQISKIVKDFRAKRITKIDFDTFMDTMNIPLLETYNTEQITDAFKVFDASGEGYVSVDDFIFMLTSLGEKLTPEEAKDMADDAERASGVPGKVHYMSYVHNMLVDPQRGYHYHSMSSAI